jgi:hypothetical protein
MKPIATLNVLLAVFLVGSMSSADSTNSAIVIKMPTSVNLELTNVSFQDAIARLFQDTGLKYYIQPGASVRIAEVKLSGLTFEQALRALTEAASYTYTVQGDAYIIGPAKKSAATTSPAPPSSSTPQAQITPAVSPPPPAQAYGGDPSQQVLADRFYARPYDTGWASPCYTAYAPPTGYGPCGFGGSGYGWGGTQPFYQFGQVRVMGGFPPVVVAGGTSSLMGFGHLPPPPPSWVSPDVLRFLRFNYAVQGNPYIVPGY